MSDLLKYLQRGFALGVGLAAGVLATALIAVTVSGTVHVFGEGEVVSAAQINENFASLKAAIESIPATNAGVTQAQLAQIAAPIGSIMAWNKDFPGTPTIPAGWVQCDGQVLNDSASPFDGQTLPNLNSSATRLLVGNTASNTITNIAQHSHTVSGNTGIGSGHTHNYTHGTLAHIPTVGQTDHTHFLALSSTTYAGAGAYNIVWIMRVK